MPHEALAASLLLAMAPTPAAALRNGLGLTPPMGFDMGGGQYIGAASMNVTTLENTWGCLSGINAGINETQMMIAADFLHSSGMFKAGYTHVHSDDWWVPLMFLPPQNVPVLFADSLLVIAAGNLDRGASAWIIRSSARVNFQIARHSSPTGTRRSATTCTHGSCSSACTPLRRRKCVRLGSGATAA